MYVYVFLHVSAVRIAEVKVCNGATGVVTVVRRLPCVSGSKTKCSVGLADAADIVVKQHELRAIVQIVVVKISFA